LDAKEANPHDSTNPCGRPLISVEFSQRNCRRLALYTDHGKSCSASPDHSFHSLNHLLSNTAALIPIALSILCCPTLLLSSRSLSQSFAAQRCCSHSILRIICCPTLPIIFSPCCSRLAAAPIPCSRSSPTRVSAAPPPCSLHRRPAAEIKCAEHHCQAAGTPKSSGRCCVGSLASR
jgi:hypothetical protein